MEIYCWAFAFKKSQTQIRGGNFKSECLAIYGLKFNLRKSRKANNNYFYLQKFTYCSIVAFPALRFRLLYLLSNIFWQRPEFPWQSRQLFFLQILKYPQGKFR